MYGVAEIRLGANNERELHFCILTRITIVQDV